jgi:hypothetical protein
MGVIGIEGRDRYWFTSPEKCGCFAGVRYEGLYVRIYDLVMAASVETDILLA